MRLGETAVSAMQLMPRKNEIFAFVCSLYNTKERLTVVIDKGMNSEDNYAWIDEHSRNHFVTAYPPILTRN